MSTEIIQTEHLTKFYKNVHAVDDISINIQKGEIYGFLGLNGAGKTTTIRMLLGMIRPTSGTAWIDGKKVNSANTDLWKKVGYLVEIPYSYLNLTVRENLQVINKLRLFNDENLIDKVIDKMKLNQYANVLSKNLSLGNSQRLGLAKALMHNPEILILDEPANGLDPAGIFEIRELLLDLANNFNVTVFISSHILGEISKFATRIGIIHNGKLIQEVNTEELEHLCKKRLLLDAKNQDLAISVLKQNNFEFKIDVDNILECVDYTAIQQPDEIAKMLVNSACPPTLLKVEKEDLETYFLRVINEKENVK